MRFLASAGALLLLLISANYPSDAAPSVRVAQPSVILRKIAADKGNVVLVNFWATWCVPCVGEYPSLVSLDRQYRSRGLDVIAVSLDFGPDAPGKVQSFVSSKHAQFPQYIMQVDDPETAIDAFDKSWQGDLPRTFIYDRQGKKITTLAGPQSFVAFTRAVKAAMVR